MDPKAVRLLPYGTLPDARIILAARGVRAFAGGYIAILLPVYLFEKGFDAVAVGVLSTATLAGSAALTPAVGTIARRFDRRHSFHRSAGRNSSVS